MLYGFGISSIGGSGGGGGGTTVKIPYWAAFTPYLVGDQVVSEDKIYRALTAHASSGSFANDLAAGDWKEISSAEQVLVLTAGENISSGRAIVKIGSQAFLFDQTDPLQYGKCIGGKQDRSYNREPC